jgi:hypothetical protein
MKLPTVDLDLPAREVGEAQISAEGSPTQRTNGGSNTNRRRGNAQQSARGNSAGNSAQSQGGNRRRRGRSRPVAASA